MWKRLEIKCSGNIYRKKSIDALAVYAVAPTETSIAAIQEEFNLTNAWIQVWTTQQGNNMPCITEKPPGSLSKTHQKT